MSQHAALNDGLGRRWWSVLTAGFERVWALGALTIDILLDARIGRQSRNINISKIFSIHSFLTFLRWLIAGIESFVIPKGLQAEVGYFHLSL